MMASWAQHVRMFLRSRLPGSPWLHLCRTWPWQGTQPKFCFTSPAGGWRADKGNGESPLKRFGMRDGGWRSRLEGERKEEVDQALWKSSQVPTWRCSPSNSWAYCSHLAGNDVYVSSGLCQAQQAVSGSQLNITTRALTDQQWPAGKDSQGCSCQPEFWGWPGGFLNWQESGTASPPAKSIFCARGPPNLATVTSPDLTSLVPIIPFKHA